MPPRRIDKPLSLPGKGDKYLEEPFGYSEEEVKPKVKRKPRRSITDDQVREIRKLLAKGVQQIKIAEQVGTTSDIVANIKRGRGYTDVV